MEEYIVAGLIASLCLVVIICATVMLFVQSNNLKKMMHRDINDIVDQINNSQYYSYRFDKVQESNIMNNDSNVEKIAKMFKGHKNEINEAAEKLNANYEYIKENALTTSSIGDKSIPIMKVDNIAMNGNITLPGNGSGITWANSKINETSGSSGPGNLTIASNKKLNINANKGVDIKTAGDSFELTVNGLGVLMGNYAEFTTVDKSVNKGGSWGIDAANPAWDPDFRGNRTGLAYSLPDHEADANSCFMEFTVPTGMKQAYVVHLPWENCRYFDIMGTTGEDSVFIKRVNSWHPQHMTLNGKKGSWQVGGHHAGATAVGVAGVNRFEKIRIQGRVGRMHLMGVGWTKEEGRDMDTGYVSWDNVYSKPNIRQAGGGNTIIGNNLQVDGGIRMGANNVISAQGRIHVHSDNDLYLLNRNGVTIGKEWGGNGNLNVQGQLCVQGVCINGQQLKKLVS